MGITDPSSSFFSLFRLRNAGRKIMGRGYDDYILKVLGEVGESGISIQNLAVNVYNMSCTLFSVPLFEDVDRSVRRYIHNNSKTLNSLVERMDKRGFYRLNTAHSSYACQLMLQFGDAVADGWQNDKSDDSQCDKNEDLSLSLF